jgi:hypothetical protein
MSFVPSMSQDQLTKTALDLIDNGLILNPELPAEILANQLIDEAEDTFREEYGHALLVIAFARMIRADRMKRARIQRPAGYEHLPLWIRLYNGKRVRLDRATRKHVKEFCKIRRGKLKTRGTEDVILCEGEDLEQKLGKAATKQKRRGITAGELLGFEF